MILRLLGLILVLGVSLHAQAPDASNFVCVKSLVVPSYPPSMKQARVTASFVARIRVTATGRAEEIKVEQKNGSKFPEKPAFTAAVDAQLRVEQFDIGCQGKTVTIEFAFELLEELPPNGQERTVFRAPNVFVIGAPPVPINP